MQETLKTGLLSVVLPAYNEESSIPRAAEVICGLLTQADIRHELIFVNDGSRDHTWEAIQKQADRYPQVRGIQFSRNFGKEAALFAGLAQARGDCAVVLDCDLQHPPEKIIDIYPYCRPGNRLIEGGKVARGKGNPLPTLPRGASNPPPTGAPGWAWTRTPAFNFRARRPADGLSAMREKNAFFRALSSWIGFSTAQVEFEVRRRLEGESKWSIRSLVRYAITNIASFSTAPLQIVTLLGVVVFLCSVLLGLHSLWQKFTGQALEGFTTIILLQLLIGSILMICLGIIGYYIAKIYEEIKDRPRYIVDSRCGGEDQDGQA